MSVFFYTKRDSFFHKLDPRTKILALAAFFAIIAFANNLYVLLGFLGIIIIFFYAAKSLSNFGKMAGLFGIIGITTFILWLLFYHGPQGRAFIFAAAMSLRFIDLLLVGLLLLSITSLEEFSAGLMLLGMPYPVAFALSLSFRLVIVFIATGFTIVEAQKVRGNNVQEGSIIKRIRAYSPLLVPLILNAVKKAETLTLALESKGFSPCNKISLKGRYKMRMADWIVLAVCVGAVAGMVVMKLK
jgi:ABC-type cobalt transport system, permease component CbiQ and related transporters